MTMYEKIKNMSLDDLALFLLDQDNIDNLISDACVNCCPECYAGSKCSDKKCHSALVKFLESPIN